MVSLVYFCIWNVHQYLIHFGLFFENHWWKIYPDLFKLDASTPVIKFYDSSNITKYRPISLSSHVVKLFELLVLHSINSILIDEHGFCPGRSTTTSSLVFSHYIFNSFINKTQDRCIPTDFTQAFDRVDHNLYELRFWWTTVVDMILYSWL